MVKYGASPALMAEIGGSPTSLARRWPERCPACGSLLGDAAAGDPATNRLVEVPSFWLEIGATTDGVSRPWRVSAVGANLPSMVSTNPRFNEVEVVYRYLICGSGHIFFDAASVSGTHVRQRTRIWNTVAVLGGFASGKTYLLVRMLHQSLYDPQRWDGSDRDDVRLAALAPLEDVLSVRTAELYEQTILDGVPIPPASADSSTPRAILDEQIPDAVNAIREMIRRTVLDGERHARTWGRRHGQPLIMRSSQRDRAAWTGFVEVPPGVLTGTQGRDAAVLATCDSLIWVIDPAVAEAVNRTAADALGDAYRGVFDASLRIGSPDDIRRVQSLRAAAEEAIGHRLAHQYASSVENAPGRTPRLLVVVTKCDLVHASLNTPGLLRLDRSDAVVRGTASYLNHILERWMRGQVAPDQPVGELLRRLSGGDADGRSVRRRRLLNVAEALLHHYSEPDAFWNLTHTGGSDRVVIGAIDDVNVGGQHAIEVPDIGQHLDDVVGAAKAGVLTLRDLVMSAVACGIAYGLGHERALYPLLRNPAYDPLFFLCSPLGTVPLSEPDDRIAPIEPGARFAGLRDGSAGLTQLMLAAMKPTLGADDSQARGE